EPEPEPEPTPTPTPTPEPAPAPAPAPASRNGDLCEDPTLPLSAERCAPAQEETWRCACHARYAVTTSQVCRGGSWVNYRLEPEDCARCAGAQMSGCD
ncbi:MAG: hypothetical protein FJ138_14005, partial [Deltaproteobacteria bacterium]|nr:hypothetical protein [Deltaproteobacteria bacterium]